jgi:hypothetical protein
MQLKKSSSQIERTALNSLEKSAGMKKAELGDYIVALKISIITDILQKAQENISAVNVENILTTLLELSLKTVVSLLRRCSTS